MIIRTVLVDDEPPARRLMRVMLEDYADVEIIAEFGRADLALDFIATQNPDLVFLDIKMPGMSGIELLSDLERNRKPGAPPFFVLVTAYGQHALNAFELQAVDYLVKPINERRFQKTMSLVLERVRQSTARILGSASDDDPLKQGKLSLETPGGFTLLDVEDVFFIESADHYLVVHHHDGKQLVRGNLADFAERLPHFLQPHRSFLVNPSKISAVEKNEICLTSKEKVPLSRRRRREMVEKLKKTETQESSSGSV